MFKRKESDSPRRLSHEEKKHKRLFVSLLALCLTAALPATAALADMIENNPAGAVVDEIAAGEYMDTNNGTVTTCNGELAYNYGVVSTFNGIISYNYGEITTNNGEVLENQAGATVETNESTGYLVENSGTVTTNKGKISKNLGTVSANEGTVSYNHGTIAANTGAVEHNLGTIADNIGTVEHNLGGLVTGAPATHNYAYKITLSNSSDVYLSGDDENDVYLHGNDAYVKENTAVTIEPLYCFQFVSAPTVTGGTLTDNGDGTYTLSGLTGDISLSASTSYITVTDITGLPASIPVNMEYDLNYCAVLTPANAPQTIRWEVTDAGTTGASFADPYEGLLSATGTGTVTIKATAERGISESEDFTKEFSITITDAVTPVYNAYTALQTALAGSSLSELTTAANAFDVLQDVYNDLDETQRAELGTMMGTTAEDAYDQILSDWIDTNIILDTATYTQDFTNDPNAATALRFVRQYESLFNDPDYADKAQKIRRFIPDIDTVYASAAAAMPDADVIAVYDGFDALMTALYNGITEDLRDADTLLDALDALESSQLQDLAILLGLPADETHAMIHYHGSSANTILATDALLQAYGDNPNTETAADFIEQYDALFNNPDDEDLLDWIYIFFPDIDEIYDAALSETTPPPTPEPTAAPTATPSPLPSDIPNTADNAAPGLWITLMLIGANALAAVLTIQRRKRMN